ncbi:tyrosine-type recombinase/integrase [Heliorestis convoluta]|uniref:Integrase family protein n=1 Tax=Heliorestis convoluta TaxID=356322 RepID=A0A5Q2N5I1_9FIRM|nr:tyrosine-type recombinase/integrase [Heliorestis convoluta]QGG48886.1 Integrase family protein [Heliorestis convoluta]
MRHYIWTSQLGEKQAVTDLGRQFQRLVRQVNANGIESKRRYIQSMQLFLRWAATARGLQKIGNISNKHLRSFVEHRKAEGISDGTIINDLSAIRFYHGFIPAKERRYELVRNPLDSARLNREFGLLARKDGRSDRAWEIDEIQSMQDKAIQLGQKEIAMAIEAGWTMGLRINEMASLTCYQAQEALTSGNLMIRGKGGKHRALELRDVPLSTNARQCLQEALERTKPGKKYLFSPDGKSHVEKFKKKIKNFIANHRSSIQLADRAKSGHNLSEGEKGALTYHGLRHTFARMQIHHQESQGLHQKDARGKTSRDLGHGRIAVTSIYTAGE